MLEIKARVRVLNISSQDKDISSPIECIVDTGATLSTLPTDILQKAGIRKKGPIKITLANGGVIKRYFGIAILQIEDNNGNITEIGTNVIFGKKTDPSLLGEVALETGGYLVDTVKGLIKKEYFTQY
ncbi:MAG: retroviral-like aspartic protease family protein [Bacteroidia bacterium]|nr:retroviral-like aspartic protease family protein [Bacteroidia bacterium]